MSENRDRLGELEREMEEDKERKSENMAKQKRETTL